jgi:hypothetical protein
LQSSGLEIAKQVSPGNCNPFLLMLYYGMDATLLFVWVVAGAFGMGYFVYGKKQAKAVPLAAGILLMVIPYFIGNFWIMLSACVLLIIAPFVIKA